MTTFYKVLIFFAWTVVLSGCSLQNAPSGRATVIGKYTDSLLDKQTNTYAIITLSIPNLILGEMTDYQITVKPDGSFSMDLPVVSPVYAAISVNSKSYDGLILLSPGKMTRLNLLLDETAKLNLRLIEGVELKSEDCENIQNVGNKVREAVVDGRNRPVFIVSPTLKERIDSMLIKMEKDLAIVFEDSMLSGNHKKLYCNLLKQFYLNGLFDYGDSDKSYYTFLRHFDLNNPPQLSDIYYSENLQLMLSKPELNIPHISDTPIADWLKEVKAILSDLTGIDSGLFYDMLVAEAYIKQLHDELNPLSEKQKENIRTYFSNPSFADILFAENKKIVLQLIEIEQNKQANVVVNKTPSVEKEKLIDAIIAKYKGKAVIVDFWETWCGPCMQALKEFKMLKEEFLNKNIVFVYISGYSPEELWKKKISAIGGEHYYLTKDEWDSIAKSYGFGSVPTYMLFDSTGKLENKISGYPGNEEMRAMIEKLLP